MIILICCLKGDIDLNYKYFKFIFDLYMQDFYSKYPKLPASKQLNQGLTQLIIEGLETPFGISLEQRIGGLFLLIEFCGIALAP